MPLAWKLLLRMEVIASHGSYRGYAAWTLDFSIADTIVLFARACSLCLQRTSPRSGISPF